MGSGYGISQSATWSRVQLLLLLLLLLLHPFCHHGYVAASVFITKLPALAGTAIDNLLLFYVDSWGIYMVMPGEFLCVHCPSAIFLSRFTANSHRRTTKWPNE